MGGCRRTVHMPKAPKRLRCAEVVEQGHILLVSRVTGLSMPGKSTITAMEIKAHREEGQKTTEGEKPSKSVTAARATAAEAAEMMMMMTMMMTVYSCITVSCCDGDVMMSAMIVLTMMAMTVMTTIVMMVMNLIATMLEMTVMIMVTDGAAHMHYEVHSGDGGDDDDDSMMMI